MEKNRTAAGRRSSCWREVMSNEPGHGKVGEGAGAGGRDRAGAVPGVRRGRRRPEGGAPASLCRWPLRLLRPSEGWGASEADLRFGRREAAAIFFAGPVHREGGQ